MKNIITTIIIIFFLPACHSEQKSKEKSTSKAVESTRKLYANEDFKNNFSRIYVKGTSIQGDSDDCYSYLRNDTIYLTTGGMLFGCTAFNLTITRDTCIASIDHFVDADIRVYTLNRDDTVLQAGIIVPAKYQKIHLDSQPKFTLGEKISGSVSIKSKSYYGLSEIDTSSDPRIPHKQGFYLKKDSDDVRFTFKCTVGKEQK